MKQIKITLLLIATSILLCSCPAPEGQEYIYVENKSDKPIAFARSINKRDTTFYCSKHGRPLFFRVNSNSTFKLNDGNTYASWDTDLQLLTIFIVDCELYLKYWEQPCDSVRKHVPILHTYRLTLSDLNRINWTIVYPHEE